MGMAASQARYLALVARKSNCEYEGQQINQARTVLSNQSANLFNQMLGLNVPVPPSTQDFTKLQFSYTDGINSSVISNWQQLSESDPEYNYVVTHYYYTDKYTGSMKKLSDPQVQFTQGAQQASGESIKAALDKMAKEYSEYQLAVAAREVEEAKAADIFNYSDSTLYPRIKNGAYSSANDSYTFEYNDNPNDATSFQSKTFTSYDKLCAENSTDPAIGAIDDAIDKLIKIGALDSKYSQDMNKDEIYYCEDGTIAFEKDLKELSGVSAGSSKTSLPVIVIDDVGGMVDSYSSKINELKDAENNALADYNEAVSEYEALSVPTYIGNSELTALANLTSDQQAEIEQIISDMTEQNIDASISSCFDSEGNYTGGIYSFKLNGTTYYTTYEDLEASYASGTGNNHIDGQIKLAYYNATYISTKIEETEKALLETDESGRFSSVRFENDTVTYKLNMETITDDAAYQDAMNQYYYDNAIYDKMIQDINAQTSIIQQQDQQLELRLKQLDTEQSALSTEMEAVKKVVDDNVESSFKTFGG